MPNPDDLLCTTKQHIKYVRNGRIIQSHIRERERAGISDSIAVFGLEAEHSRFVASDVSPPPKLECGRPHDLTKHEAFLRALGAQAIT